MFTTVVATSAEEPVLIQPAKLTVFVMRKNLDKVSLISDSDKLGMVDTSANNGG